ncbi:MAG: zinc metalloprotease HtpX [Candidatus Bathyarchaeia archaeon]
MSLAKLRLSMIGTITLIIAVSTLFFTVLLSWLGSFDLLSLFTMVAGFNIAQWLFAPYLIDGMYKVKEIPKERLPWLQRVVESVARKTGMKAPKLMVAQIPLPNAFAYGSPLAGNRVAVTEGLLRELQEEEVEAVVGHELGHLNHKDVQVMMFASLLPAIFYYIGNSFLYSSMYGGTQRDRGQGASSLIGMGSIAAYWILNLFVLGLSRLREYYADQFSAQNIEDGARKLSEALAKIATKTSEAKRKTGGLGAITSFKALMIEDPDRADATVAAMSRYVVSDSELVRSILSRKVSFLDRLNEVFSTHPNIVKRLRALQELA